MSAKKIFLSLIFLLTACSKQQFTRVAVPVAPPVKKIEDLGTASFKMSNNVAAFTQETLDDNHTNLTFSILGADGFYANNLKKEDLFITENSTRVGNFNFKSNSQNIDQIVDIVFVLDISGSMKPTIEAAKIKIRDFIYHIRNQQIHTRFCLVTFGDLTVSRCNKFADNNPKDQSTWTQVQEFINQLTAIQTPTGWGSDYGGTDEDEGQLRAVIDATQVPWLSNSQRFGILVTDAGFHYAPQNKGGSGDSTPTYDETLAALQAQQMRLFVAAPNRSGYSKNFSGKPSLVQAGQGLFYNYPDLLAGRITMETILSKIIQRMKTTYTVAYSSGENVGLNPTLPLAKRQIQISVPAQAGLKLESLQVQSNLPSGRAEYQKSWKLADKSIEERTLQVKINGLMLNSGYYLQNGSIHFTQAPAAGAKIDVSYYYSNLADNMRIEPFVIRQNIEASALQVYFNDNLADPRDYVLHKNADGTTLFYPSTSALSNQDPFRIRELGELRVHLLSK